MNDTGTQPSKGKAIAIVVLVAIFTALLVTAVQVLVSGKAHTAVTGGVVGAVTALAAITTFRKKS